MISLIKRTPYKTGLLPQLADNFDPINANETNKTTILSQICARLAVLGEDLQLYPALAESWTADNLTK
jgi:ABC-type transport system substrate-binding protein